MCVCACVQLDFPLIQMTQAANDITYDIIVHFIDQLARSLERSFHLQSNNEHQESNE